MNGAHKLVQVPAGVQCFVGGEARRRRAIEERVLSVFKGWDYEEIIPPLYDYADVFASPALASRTYSFVGRDGSLLALRPDFTSLLAKIAAGRLVDQPAPLRLYYSGEVLRYEPPKAGRQSELFQMGLEHLGGDSGSADVEVLGVAAECLETLGVDGWVIALGHAGVLGALVAEAGLDGPLNDAIRERVGRKDADGVREALRSARVAEHAGEALVRLATLAGGASVIDEAEQVLGRFPAAHRAVGELGKLVAALSEAGLGDRLAIDLAEVRDLDYYTGLVFRVYAPGLGFEVGGGGRYDNLLERFGRPMPAVGFSLGLDRVSLLLERQQRPVVPEPPRAESLSGDGLGQRLARARQRRAEGARVRFVEEEAP